MGSRDIVDDVDHADLIFHNGAGDREALLKFMTSLSKAQDEACKMSEWIGVAMETALTTTYNGRSPATLPEIIAALEHMKAAADNADVMRAQWRTSHGTNVKAILAVHSARKAWRALAKKDPPRKRLNLETRFGVFVADLLEALKVGADASAAFAAWSRIVSDDRGPLTLEG